MTASTTQAGSGDFAQELGSLFGDKALLSRIQAEAVFGRNEIEREIGALPAGSTVLDVGCGTGYLLALLAHDYPELIFSGMEPIGSGFQQFETTLARVEETSPNLTIFRSEIESFVGPEDWRPPDLIFSVNVFEHLTDWRSGVDRSVELLGDDGRLVVLCPNYAVPYEPHFSLPLIGGAKFSRRFFASRIEAFEAQNDADGLWASLNFITAPDLARHCRLRGYGVAFDRSIMARMLGRLDTDKEFAQRQSGVAKVAGMFSMLGGAKLLEALPARFSPYLKATITLS